MGLFSRKKNSGVETRQFMPFLQSVFSNGTFRAEYNLAVDNAVSLIANTISTLPVRLYTFTKTGHTEAWWNPISQLLRQPAVEETKLLFYKTLVRQLLLSGNAYIFLHRYEGKIMSLELIDPTFVTVLRNNAGHKIFQIAGERGGTFSDRDVLHIPLSGEGYNGTTGRSPVDVHRDTVARNDVIAEYIAVFFHNGIGSRLLVELNSDDYKAGSPKMDKLMQDFTVYFNKFVLGVENANRPIITPPSTKISKIEQSNNQNGQVLELYRDSCNEVYRIFNIPPEVIDSQQSKYASLEAKNVDFLNLCIKPLCLHIAESLEKGLLLPEEQRKMYIEFDWSALLETDPAKKAEYELKLFHGGALTLNELRDRLNYSAVENETEGETRWIPGNLLPLREDIIESLLAKSKLALQQGQMTPAEKDEEGHNPSGRDMMM